MVVHCAVEGIEGVKFYKEEEMKKATPISPFLSSSFFLMP